MVNLTAQGGEDRAEGGPGTVDEDRAIARIASLLPGKRGAGEVFIGDDAAVLAPPGGSLLVATDAVVAGVHLDLAYATLADLGWKAMAVNLSDIAAMGGTPSHAVVSVVAPEGTDLDLLYEGIVAPSAAYGCPVVGGDLANPPAGTGTISVVVTVCGETGSSRFFGSQKAVLRSGARPQEAIFTTGPLGSSAAGLERLRSGVSRDDPLCRAHLRPVPRVAEGRSARSAGASAMIDVSDGLALDLHRLASASGVGFALDEVPVADGATLAHAIGGGEDYELVFTAPDPRSVMRAFSAAGLRAPIRIGRCVADPSERTLGGDPLPPEGWQHRF